MADKESGMQENGLNKFGMQENGLNKSRTFVSEVSSFMSSPVYERRASLCKLEI